MGKFRNLIGQRFGRLLVQTRAPNKKFGKMRWTWVAWNCLCDCGTPCVVTTESLVSGHTKSCGCYRKEYLINPDAPLILLLSQYRESTKRTKREFLLSLEEFRVLTSSVCFYCGVAPARVMISHLGLTYKWNGIDRVDNNKGYTLDNTVPCCSQCNQAKHCMTQEEFLLWIDRLVRFRQPTQNS
jgi:hypothetical protein